MEFAGLSGQPVSSAVHNTTPASDKIGYRLFLIGPPSIEARNADIPWVQSKLHAI
jgi:hypothetical protein